MGYRDEMINIVYNRWKVLSIDKVEHNNVIAECKCGTIKSVDAINLKEEKSKSCGCLQKELMSTHGLSTSRIYNILQNMKDRCYNKNNIKFKYYGGKGVTICDEWNNSKNGFENFNSWSIRHEYKENLTIDRINVNGIYEPNNCRWVDNYVQANNTTRNIFVTINGDTKTLTQFAYDNHLKPDLVWKRYKKGLIGEDLIEPCSRVKIHGAIIVEDENGKHEFKNMREASGYVNLSQGSIYKYIHNISKPKKNILVYRKEDAIC